MDADYPAAHSMDTTWFAVDAKGQVAMFTSGENGHVPEHNGRDLEDEMLTLHEPAGADDFVWGEELARQVGLYHYDFPDGCYYPIGPYDRLVVPAHPLHVDQLPPWLREQCRIVCFEQVDFAAAEHLQPNEFVPCVYWGDQQAYVCADGVTVRPVPGKEGAFAAFVRTFRAEHPDAAARLVFDGPTD